MKRLINLFQTPPYRKYRLPSFTGKLYLIQWNPERYTDLHGHDGKDCHFYILNNHYNYGYNVFKKYFNKILEKNENDINLKINS